MVHVVWGWLTALDLFLIGTAGGAAIASGAVHILGKGKYDALAESGAYLSTNTRFSKHSHSYARPWKTTSSPHECHVCNQSFSRIHDIRWNGSSDGFYSCSGNKCYSMAFP